MTLHIKDIPPEAFEGGHKHFLGLIVPTSSKLTGPVVGPCAACGQGTVRKINGRQACDRCGSGAARHPDPAGYLREKGLEEFIQK